MTHFARDRQPQAWVVAVIGGSANDQRRIGGKHILPVNPGKVLLFGHPQPTRKPLVASRLQGFIRNHRVLDPVAVLPSGPYAILGA